MNSIDIKAIREELAQALSRTFDGSRSIAVYGAGNTAERNVRSFTEIEQEAGFSPEYYIDDTPQKHGTIFLGKPVINFEEAHELCKGMLILISSDVTKSRDIMAGSLRKAPIEGAEDFTTLDDYMFCRHAEEVLSVYDMLEDDLSKVTYANMFLLRMLRAKQNQKLVSERTYYEVPEFQISDSAEVFVDCGAYTGDTVEQFLMERGGKFQKVFAFEPLESNFRELVSSVERLKDKGMLFDDQIVLTQAGVGERTYQVEPVRSSEATDIGYSLAGSIASEGKGIPMVSIDDFFSIQPISFLKADIEGLEWRMLQGAERTIRRDKPKIAICVYHSCSDMYRIALKVKEICLDYKLSLRQHSHDILDTVLYAYL